MDHRFQINKRWAAHHLLLHPFPEHSRRASNLSHHYRMVLQRQQVRLDQRYRILVYLMAINNRRLTIKRLECLRWSPALGSLNFRQQLEVRQDLDNR